MPITVALAKDVTIAVRVVGELLLPAVTSSIGYQIIVIQMALLWISVPAFARLSGNQGFIVAEIFVTKPSTIDLDKIVFGVATLIALGLGTGGGNWNRILGRLAGRLGRRRWLWNIARHVVSL